MNFSMDAGLITEEFWRNGPTPGGVYNFPGGSTSSRNSAVNHTLHPMTTGSSVLGLKFTGGVMIAADTLGSYGSLARFRDCERVMKVNNNTMLGCSGDYADFQFLQNIIKQAVIEEECLNDGFRYTPKSLFNWVTRVLYNRRSRINPLWNTYIVGGMEAGEPFLGYIDKIGTAYEAPTLATGYGAYIAQPLMRKFVEEKGGVITEQEAKDVLDRCMKILFYRDGRTLNKYQLAITTKDEGTRIEGPISSKTNWDIASMVKGYE